MLRVGISLFIKELILFGLTLVLGLYAAYYYSNLGDFLVDKTIKFTLTDLVVSLVFFGAVFFLARNKRFSSLSFKIFLLVIVFSGAQVVLGTIVPSPWDVAAAVILTLIFSKFKNVLTHNLGIILGISGIAAVFGLSIPVNFGLILLVVLSAYDIVAVYVTKHMVTMARRMVEGGAIFGFLIPFEFRGFLYGKNEARAKVGESFMILGSGDIGLPLIFAASLVRISLASAIITAIFSLLVLLLTHILFINQQKRISMAALPPIATFTIIGYLVTQLL